MSEALAVYDSAMNRLTHWVHDKLVSWICDAVVWGCALMAASGLGQLLAAIWETEL